jgi:hypothetical protein
MSQNHYSKLPLWRDATRLLVVLEEAVRGFPRYHKYALGSDLRTQARQVCRLILRAYEARESRIQELDRLVLAIDELKLLIQLGKETRAFASFAAFQQAAELAVALGRQSGGVAPAGAGSSATRFGWRVTRDHCAPPSPGGSIPAGIPTGRATEWMPVRWVRDGCEVRGLIVPTLRRHCH